MSTAALIRPITRPVEAYAGAGFVNAFTVCLLLMSIPIKNFGYIVPPVFFVLQLFYGNTLFVQRTVLWACLAVCLSAVAILLDSLAGQIVNPPGLPWGLLTYASLFTLLGARRSFIIGPQARRNLEMVVTWWLIVQSAIGLMQFAISRNSDAVCGTMGLFEFIDFNVITITQVYFTVNLFAMILFLAIDTRRLATKIAIAMGLLACIVAHSGHQTMFIMAAIGFVGALQMRPAVLLKFGVALTVLVALVVSISEIDMTEAKQWAEYTLRKDAPKRMGVDAGTAILSSPKNLIMGTGMGQFSSRAALVSSGEHVLATLPPFLVGQSDYYREYLVPAFAKFLEEGEGSAMSKPYSSALNVVVEFGVPVTLLMMVGLAIAFVENQRLSRSADQQARLLGLLSNIGIVFLVLCCFIENYLEYPQAVFLPLLLYVAAHAPSAPAGDSPRPVVIRRG